MIVWEDVALAVVAALSIAVVLFLLIRHSTFPGWHGWPRQRSYRRRRGTSRRRQGFRGAA